MKHLTYARLRDICLKMNYAFFETGDYNINIVGVRSIDTHANTFNDVICVAFKVGNATHVMQFKATTDAGVYYRNNPVNVNGTAVMLAGQYRGFWQLGWHKNKYKALVQKSPIWVGRDNNKDSKIKTNGKTEHGMFGINCHRASVNTTSKVVDKFSAGCQVLANSSDFELLISLCRIAAERYGNSFTYTLIDEADLWNL